ncbi:hypothetical protein GCM10017673_26320 [Streptosporangium violaceochromogenes]|nr:hypothetical protein GCM10017673_26320 [Streptosporangium violaceochromogenes]
MGIARLALLGLAVLALVAMVVLGALSLIGVLGAGAARPKEPPPVAASPLASSSDAVPTIRVRCLRQRCPTVFLRVAGGDVLFDREMTADEQVQSFEAKVNVVLADSASVTVEVNGVARPPDKPGRRQEFVATRN